MTLTPADMAFAESLDLPSDRLRPADTRYLEEPRGKYPGTAGLLALPHSTEEVATLITAAARAKIRCADGTRTRTTELGHARL